MDPFATLTPQVVLDSVAQGVYVTDASRKILYWNAMAETITGWPAAEIVGRCCYDNILCHVDKDGHRLCGEEHCPLHRSIMTGQTCTVPGAVWPFSGLAGGIHALHQGMLAGERLGTHTRRPFPKRSSVW